ncbi:hypothetical protein V6N12_068074 [Hibiscus sabdariffa]|uniref:Uncharacterized protein n=1 Tax=Hibiscus sabdariffa TaxID=183260 RepID=A0ABR2FNZ4_9ROSI
MVRCKAKIDVISPIDIFYSRMNCVKEGGNDVSTTMSLARFLVTFSKTFDRGKLLALEKPQEAHPSLIQVVQSKFGYLKAYVNLKEEPSPYML